MNKLDYVLANVESFATSSDIISDGNHFYTKLPDGDLAFVHKRFTPSTIIEIKSFKDQIGFCHIGSYEDFLLKTDGLILFNNRIIIFGLRENIVRGLDFNKQKSISVSSLIRRRGDNSNEWFPIGAISLYDIVLDIELNRSGQARLGERSLGYKLFSGFVDLLLFIWESACVLLDRPVVVLPEVNKLEQNLRNSICGMQH